MPWGIRERTPSEVSSKFQEMSLRGRETGQMEREEGTRATVFKALQLVYRAQRWQLNLLNELKQIDNQDWNRSKEKEAAREEAERA